MRPDSELPRSRCAPGAARRARGDRLQPALVVGPRDDRLFRRLDRDLWEQTGHNPVLMLGQHRPGAAPRGRPGRGVPRAPRPRRGRSEEYMAGAGTWYAKQSRPRRRAAGGLLLDGVRPHRVPADLLRRPRHPRRRPPQVGQRPGRAARRRRPALPEGLLPPVPERGLAAGALPDNDFSTMPVRPVHDAAGRPVRDRRRPRPAGPSCSGRGGRRSAGSRSPARHQPPREPAGPRTSPTSSTAATRSCASGRRSCSASAACGR